MAVLHKELAVDREAVLVGELAAEADGRSSVALGFVHKLIILFGE